MMTTEQQKLYDWWDEQIRLRRKLIRLADAARLLDVQSYWLVREVERGHFRSERNPTGQVFLYLPEVMEVAQWPVKVDQL
jgi:hypothetical protein